MRVETIDPGFATGSRAKSFDLTQTDVIGTREPVHTRTVGQAQQNVGAALKSPDGPDRSGRRWRPQGAQRINVVVGGVQHSLDLSLPVVASPRETAAAVAREVRAARLGLGTKVQTTRTKNPRIQITGQRGAARAFTVTDSLGTSASRTGAGNTVRTAAGNARVGPTRQVEPTAQLGMDVRPTGALVLSLRV